MYNPQNPRRELIDHIRENLCDYEDPYREGAWENFNKKKKKSTIPIFRYIAAAVIAGIIFYLLLPINDYTEPANKQVRQEIVKQSHHIPKSKPEPTNQTHNTRQYNHEKSGVYFIEESTIGRKSYLAEEPLMSTINPFEVLEKELINIKGRDSVIETYTAAITSLDSVNENLKITLQKSLLDADFTELDAVTNRSKKWGVDIQVSSSMIKSGNISAGIEVGYKLTNRFIISSGLSVRMLSTTEEFNGVPSTNRHLRSTDAKLTGVEIPLEIKYSVSANFYTSVGLTSFAVLDDYRINNYVEQNTVTESVQLVSRQTVTNISVVERGLSEKAPPSTFIETDHVGFYSFSFGYKGKLSPKNTFAVEPFVKIPVPSLSNSDLKLSNGGVKIKIGF